MQLIGKLDQDKRGIGSIIGATFLVFILLSGFTFYILTVNINDGYTAVLQTMDQLDLQKKQENVEFVSISTTNEDKLNVTVKNAGSHQTQLIWLGIFDETVTPNTQEYHKMDVYINPAETLSNIPEENITILEGQERVIQLVTELGNTFNSNYPPREEATITITGKNCTTTHNPSQWNLLGSTQNVSGSVADLASNDSSYAIFNSYYSGTSTNTNHFVDNNSSNVDNSTNTGTHSNFTAVQYGPDLINDTLTEGNTGTTSLFEYYNTGDDDGGGGAWAGFKLCQTFSSSTSFSITSVKLLLYRIGNAGTVTVGIYATTGNPAYPTGSVLTSGTTNGNTLPTASPYEWREITLTAYALQASTTYAIVVQCSGGNGGNAVYWRDDSTSPTYGNGMYGRSLSSGSWDAGAQMDNTRDGMFEVWGASYSYQLNIEEQFTSVDTGAYTNKELCIFAGTWSTSETIKVDVWNTTSTSWVTVIASLTKNAWNNVSIANLLTATVTIRFTDGTPSSDTVQDSWSIDATLLHLWTTTDQYTAEVEFVGSSNLQNWIGLGWQIQSCWDIGQVTVTIQLYNFTLGAYASNGNGYLSYVSSTTPNTNELMPQTITSSPNDFKNSTGHWRVKIKGVKSTSTQFLFKVDWVNFETTYSTTGSTVPYNGWQWYTIRATTASGGPIPYGYVSIYANGTSVAFRNATDKASIENPAWMRLDARGEFQLEIKSTSGSPETFVLYAVVGSVVGEKTITQEAP